MAIWGNNNNNNGGGSGISEERVLELIDQQPLVTEEENGLARAIDKQVLDKSFLNVNISDMNFNDAEAASSKLVQLSDGYYYPITGQTIQWKDREDKLHISRFYEALGITGTDQQPYVWLGGAVDENGVIVLNGIMRTNSESGPMVYAVSTDGVHWKYGVATTTVERWMPIQYGNGRWIATSGNDSAEYIVGQYVDGDMVWSVSSNMPNPNHSQMFYINDQWILLAKNSGVSRTYYIYTYNPDNNNSFNQITTVILEDGINNSIEQSTIRAWGDKIYVARPYSIEIFSAEFASYSSIRTEVTSYYDTIQLNNIVYLYTRRENTNRLYRISNNDLVAIDTQIPKATNIVALDQDLLWLATENTNMSQFVYRLPSSSYDTKGAYVPTQNPIQLIPYGNDILVISGTLWYSGVIKTSDYVYSVKIDSQIGVPGAANLNNENRWEEIPVLPTGNNALIMRHDNDFKSVQLDQLILNGDTLKVDSSDEYITPVGYKCIPLDPSEPTLYCPVPLADVTTDGNTEVFEDPQCLYYYGYITNKSFNPNNPTEIEVTVWREGSEVKLYYLITDTLYPNTIATTKAVMQLSKKLNIADYAYPVFLGIFGYEDQKLYELCSKKSFELQSGAHAEGLLDLEKMDLNILPNFEINESYPYYDFEILNFSGTYEDGNGAIRQICEDRETDGTFVSMKAEGNKLYLSYNKNDVLYTNVFFQVRFIITPHKPV